jgi:NADH-quinone oxidoreductase subunit I
MASSPKITGYFGTLFKGSWSLIQGLGITGKNFFRKEVTLQYPEQREEMPEGYRGPVRLKEHPGGQHACTACGACIKACPVACIWLTTEKDENGKRRLATYSYEMERCMFCSLCVENCAFDALEMSRDYENAVYDRKLLTRELKGKLTFRPKPEKEKKPVEAGAAPVEGEASAGSKPERPARLRKTSVAGEGGASGAEAPAAAPAVETNAGSAKEQG